MKKNPKTTVHVQAGKNPKTQVDPNLYRDLPISWQLHKIDLESVWGIKSLKNNFVFAVDDLLLESLDNISEELYTAITELNKKQFQSIDEFIARLHAKCNGLLTAEHQRLILKSIAENVFWTEILPKLTHFETTSWMSLQKETYGDKKKTKHHLIPVDKIIPEAQKRLTDLKLDDLSELFSLRLTGKIRIWAIPKLNVLQVLWFDFEHKICPSSYN